MKQYTALGETIYLFFAGNDTSGSGGDGASPAADVRLAGAAADAAPVYSPTPTLLSHANYPAGCYEIAIVASAGNGFAVNNTYAVFCTLAIDSQNPTGFIGSFDLKPVISNAKQINGTAQTGNDVGADVNAILVDTNDLQTNQSNWATAIGFSTHNAAAVKTAMEAAGTKLTLALEDTGELQEDWVNGGRLDNLLDAIPVTAMRGTDSAYTGTPPTVGAIADQVLDEALSAHVAAGSLGKKVGDQANPPSQTLNDYKATGFNIVVPDEAGVAATPAEVLTQIQSALNEAFTDATGINANSLKNRIRTLMWILRNKMSVTNANGNTVILKDDDSTQAFSVNAALTDDSTTTVRKRIA